MKNGLASQAVLMPSKYTVKGSIQLISTHVYLQHGSDFKSCTDQLEEHYELFSNSVHTSMHTYKLLMHSY